MEITWKQAIVRHKANHIFFLLFQIYPHLWCRVMKHLDGVGVWSALLRVLPTVLLLTRQESSVILYGMPATSPVNRWGSQQGGNGFIPNICILPAHPALVFSPMSVVSRMKPTLDGVIMLVLVCVTENVVIIMRSLGMHMSKWVLKEGTQAYKGSVWSYRGLW